MKGLFGVLLTLSLVAVIAGVGYLTQITLGVGIMVGACYLGIVARLVQAEYLDRKEA